MTMFNSLVLAASLFTISNNGVDVTLSSECDVIDPAKSVFVDLKIVSPGDVEVVEPDLAARARGFSSVENVADEPYVNDEGRRVVHSQWRLVPEPCAKEYKIAPFAVKTKSGFSFVAGPVYFKNPPARADVSGEMQINPQKDPPPFSWKLVGRYALIALGLLAAVALAWLLIRYVLRRVKEHKMTPVERAWVELERLIKRNLPQAGKFKDFYVELTLVVRRYIQRKHGLKAPHLTTEEFFAEVERVPSFPKNAIPGLMEFLNAADMIKFAGVKATLELADEAAESARVYIVSDESLTKGGGK